jgi:hypothetical protein
MEEWHLKGVEDWKTNQQQRKERENKQLEFEYSQASKLKDFTIRKIEEATTEVHHGIDEFEATLRKQGINPRKPTIKPEGTGSQSPLKTGFSGPRTGFT